MASTLPGRCQCGCSPNMRSRRSLLSEHPVCVSGGAPSTLGTWVAAHTWRSRCQAAGLELWPVFTSLPLPQTSLTQEGKEKRPFRLQSLSRTSILVLRGPTEGQTNERVTAFFCLDTLPPKILTALLCRGWQGQAPS